MELTLAELVLTVVIGSGAVVLFCVVVSRWQHAGVEKKSLEKRFICRLCLHGWVDEGNDRIVRCPECGAKNERGRSRRLG
ncbi:MAG: hypothetical protein ACQCXQ_08480 [Verrucomicrobiales bacterium]|nr:hypothetical protein [Verrucomicrobiota bacterium JB025]